MSEEEGAVKQKVKMDTKSGILEIETTFPNGKSRKRSIMPERLEELEVF